MLYPIFSEFLGVLVISFSSLHKMSYATRCVNNYSSIVSVGNRQYYAFPTLFRIFPTKFLQWEPWPASKMKTGQLLASFLILSRIIDSKRNHCFKRESFEPNEDHLMKTGIIWYQMRIVNNQVNNQGAAREHNQYDLYVIIQYYLNVGSTVTSYKFQLTKSDQTSDYSAAYNMKALHNTRSNSKKVKRYAFNLHYHFFACKFNIHEVCNQSDAIRIELNSYLRREKQVCAKLSILASKFFLLLQIEKFSISMQTFYGKVGRYCAPCLCMQVCSLYDVCDVRECG